MTVYGDLALSRLTWPSGLVRERAATAVACLMADEGYDMEGGYPSLARFSTPRVVDSNRISGAGADATDRVIRNGFRPLRQFTRHRRARQFCLESCAESSMEMPVAPQRTTFDILNQLRRVGLYQSSLRST